MSVSDPLRILLAQNEWATRSLLVACRALSREQFHREFPIGPGSLHATTTHIIGSMRHWGDVLAGRDPRPRLEKDGAERTPDDLLALLSEVALDLERTATGHPLDELVTGLRGGTPFQTTRGGLLTHVLTHGVHHRAQCLNMLRQLGVAPLPPSSVLDWLLSDGQVLSGP